ncbi:MAG: hypothetical protein ABR577_17080 [Pyrinomonadaceae bacterium]
MKQDSDNMIDFLLRRHAQKNLVVPTAHSAETPIEAGTRIQSTSNNAIHLDADELASFAENAVPANTRARYITHLADCDACRSILISLAQTNADAHQTAMQSSTQSHSVRASWRETFAAFWSARNLRFAAPAFAVLAVAIIIALIAGVAMRRHRNEEILVASNHEEQTRIDPIAAPGETQTPSTENITAAEKSANQSPASRTSGNTAIQPNGSTAPVKQAGDAGTSGAGMTARSDAIAQDKAGTKSIPDPTALARDERQAAAADDDAIRIVPQNSFPSVASAPSPSAAQSTTASESANVPGVAAGVVAAVNNAASSKKMNTRISSNDAAGVAASSAAKPEQSQASVARRRATRAPTETDAAPPPPSPRGAVADNAAKAPEVRRVSGREFRKQGGVWVDTAYASPPQTLTSVARGSEQYRALVADEPAIRKIADQLGGEIIVVWKRRAYRIR